MLNYDYYPCTVRSIFCKWQDTVGSCGSLCFSGFVDFSDIDS